jgi:hypothetical protein
LLWNPDFPLFGGVRSAQRVFGPLVESAAVGLEDGTILVVTTGHADGIEWTVRSWVLTPHPEKQIIETVHAEAPALAASKDRIALAFMTEDAVRVLFVNRVRGRVGDTLTAAPVHSRPVLAFAGDTLVVFWVEIHDSTTRLREATLVPGAKAFSPPRDAVDDPIVDIRPTAARLGSGEWAVAWVAAPGGKQIVRVSSVGAGGELIGPSDVGDAVDVRALDSATTGARADVAWSEAAGETLNVARVGCAKRP